MRSILVGIPVAVLIAASSFAETIITAQDYAVDSDVALESAVREVKAIPQDTVNVAGDVAQFVKDEMSTAAEGVASVFDGESAHVKAQRTGELAVEDAWDADNNIQFRSYKVSERLGDLLQAYAPDKSVPAIDVADFFTDVEFPERTSARYLPEFKSLFVNQTLPNLLAVEEVLAGYQEAQKNLLGHQVEIEAKFIEVNQSTLDELGFNWSLDKNGGNIGLADDVSIAGPTDLFSSGLRGAATALTGAQAPGLLTLEGTSGAFNWSVEINALEQANDSDVLSSPRVVTQSGEEATIAVGEDRMIPKSFDIENQDTSPYVQNADWESELMGVQMEVTPQIRMDGLIDLTINSKILDIIGYDSYQIAPTINSGGPNGAALFTGNPAADASLPYFRIRKLETRATLADGSTIGMGGLIYDKLETFRDKVPVLGSIPLVGRLFRSEGERSIKRNLMIFVTATQVDVDGRRLADLALKK